MFLGQKKEKPVKADVSVMVELELGAAMPEYQTVGSSGADIRAFIRASLLIKPGERAIISTGLRLSMPDGFEGQLRSRSGLAAHHGIICLNSPGTIDQDYRGEVKVILHNNGSEPYTVKPGDRIAQLVICPVVRASFKSADSSVTVQNENAKYGKKNQQMERGDGGFGSTGK